MKYRDPSSILIEILTDIYVNLKSFDVGGELLFVYNVIYNSNSLNIRNECIHKNWQLLFAFKLTLMCIHIIMLGDKANRYKSVDELCEAFKNI